MNELIRISNHGGMHSSSYYSGLERAIDPKIIKLQTQKRKALNEWKYLSEEFRIPKIYHPFVDEKFVFIPISINFGRHDNKLVVYDITNTDKVLKSELTVYSYDPFTNKHRKQVEELLAKMYSGSKYRRDMKLEEAFFKQFSG